MPKRNDWPTANEMLTALDKEDARQKEVLRQFRFRDDPGFRLLRWLKDRWLWLRWFSL